jgi:hypothetical protein
VLVALYAAILLIAVKALFTVASSITVPAEIIPLGDVEFCVILYIAFNK